MVSLIIVAVAMLAAFALGFIGIPFAKEKGWIKAENFKDTMQILNLMSMVMQEIKPEDNFINVATKVASTCVLSAEQMFNAGDNIAKKTYAVDMAIKICQEMKIELDDNKKDIINAAIESLVLLLPKTNEPKQ